MSTSSVAAPSDYSEHSGLQVDGAARCVSVSGEVDIATVPLMLTAAVSVRMPRRRISRSICEALRSLMRAHWALAQLLARQRERSAALRVIGNIRVARLAGLTGLGIIITEFPDE